MLCLQVRKKRSWPRSWTNFSRLLLHSDRNAWANWHLLGQLNTFLVPGPERAGPAAERRRRGGRSQGRHCHSTLSLTVIDFQSLGIYTVQIRISNCQIRPRVGGRLAGGARHPLPGDPPGLRAGTSDL
jgi:hypothetical protein